MQIDQIKTIKKKPFYLLNLPYFLAGELDKYLEWFKREIDRGES